jgi:tetratricopeptide (TPR) repeat protein
MSNRLLVRRLDGCALGALVALALITARAAPADVPASATAAAGLSPSAKVTTSAGNSAPANASAGKPAGGPAAPSQSNPGGAARPAQASPSKIPPEEHQTPAQIAEEIKGLLRLGAKLSDREDYDTAEIAYWQILNRPLLTVTDEKSALLALAHMLRKKGDPPSLTKAAAIYEKFVKEFADDEQVPQALLELGRTFRDMGVYQLAINRFYSVINSTLKFSPQDFHQYELVAKTAQFEIAQTYFDEGNYAEAGKFFGRVRLLDLAPQDRARAQFMAASSEQLAGNLSSAVTILQAFLVQSPDDANVPEARFLLATTLRQLKRPQEALAVTLDLLRDERSRTGNDPKTWLYWQRRTGNQVANDFFQSGDTFNALVIYKGLRDLAPDTGWRLSVAYQIALCYERLFQFDEARTTYQTIIDSATERAGTPPPSDEVKEMGRMAAWRLAHMEWRDKVQGQFNTVFTTSGNAVPAQPPPPPAPKNPS